MKGILTICLALFGLALRGQYYEVGSYLGFSTYLGELSQQRLLPEESGLMLGVFGRYNITPWLSAKAGLTKGTLSGSDANARTEAERIRNLSFRSNVLEFAVTGEFNLLEYNIRANKTAVPYAFLGLALFHHNPQAQMRGQWYDLREMHTENRGYRLTQVAIPVGLGFKFNISYKLNFGLEFGARRTFTDYLDDVSTYYPDVIGMRAENPVAAALAYRSPELTGEFGDNPAGQPRGEPLNRDWYFFSGLTISVNLTDKYGLDFDPQYEAFKSHLKKKRDEARGKEKVPKRKKTLRYQRKKRGKKKMLEMPAKKRTH